MTDVDTAALISEFAEGGLIGGAEPTAAKELRQAPAGEQACSPWRVTRFRGYVCSRPLSAWPGRQRWPYRPWRRSRAQSDCTPSAPTTPSSPTALESWTWIGEQVKRMLPLLIAMGWPSSDGWLLRLQLLAQSPSGRA